MGSVGREAVISCVLAPAAGAQGEEELAAATTTLQHCEGPSDPQSNVPTIGLAGLP